MKGFVHIRVDDRLIHGQVATRWSMGLKVNRIMVIDDQVASNETEKSVLRLAAPTGINTSILPFEKAVSNIKNGNYDGQRVMLIVKSPETLLQMFEAGVNLLDINIGNMSNRPDTVQYKKSVSMTEAEKEATMKLIEEGIKVTAQMVPDDPTVGIQEFFNKK
ncbi:PTS sugar transporter subunit IIB [Vagococcus fluvialis]|uniref:PTS sugar transporter subunit IIB n=1 Tax=Vagococcus fluvialis TaxID=2738 RepID=UPI001A8E5917|nr:PTS sugar transporter subunit IIB [Vagococcus fluvialis]MBO0438425.1 PTS sugar transporter subunit IIB [Vagococcus fluvialis]